MCTGAISFVSIGCITLITVLVLVAGPVYSVPGAVTVFNVTGMFQKLGSIIFALSCTSATFHAYGSTKNASPALWGRIMGQSTLGGSLLCCIMGLAGMRVCRFPVRLPSHPHPLSCRRGTVLPGPDERGDPAEFQDLPRRAL